MALTEPGGDFRAKLLAQVFAGGRSSWLWLDIGLERQERRSVGLLREDDRRAGRLAGVHSNLKGVDVGVMDARATP